LHTGRSPPLHWVFLEPIRDGLLDKKFPMLGDNPPFLFPPHVSLFMIEA
jgi:hypothetical protein